MYRSSLHTCVRHPRGLRYPFPSVDYIVPQSVKTHPPAAVDPGGGAVAWLHPHFGLDHVMGTSRNIFKVPKHVRIHPPFPLGLAVHPLPSLSTTPPHAAVAFFAVQVAGEDSSFSCLLHLDCVMDGLSWEQQQQQWWLWEGQRVPSPCPCSQGTPPISSHGTICTQQWVGGWGGGWEWGMQPSLQHR